MKFNLDGPGPATLIVRPREMLRLRELHSALILQGRGKFEEQNGHRRLAAADYL